MSIVFEIKRSNLLKRIGYDGVCQNIISIARKKSSVLG